MKKKTLLSAAAAAAAFAFSLTVTAQEGDAPAYGGKADVAFAEKLWKAMEGYESWKLTTSRYEGRSPHGKWVRLWSTWVKVDGESHPIIIKDNYGGRGVTVERIREDRRRWLESVTIMLQRDPGYDDENQDWYWVKYGKDGSIAEAKGKKLAGRIESCIACHSMAKHDDYLFSNDE